MVVAAKKGAATTGGVGSGGCSTNENSLGIVWHPKLTRPGATTVACAHQTDPEAGRPKKARACHLHVLSRRVAAGTGGR